MYFLSKLEYPNRGCRPVWIRRISAKAFFNFGYPASAISGVYFTASAVLSAPFLAAFPVSLAPVSTAWPVFLAAFVVPWATALLVSLVTSAVLRAAFLVPCATSLLVSLVTSAVLSAAFLVSCVRFCARTAVPIARVDATVVISIAFIDTLIATLLFGAINPLALYTNPSLLLTIARRIILVVHPPDAQRPRKRRIVIARNHDELLAVRAGLVGFRELPGMHFRLRD